MPVIQGLAGRREKGVGEKTRVPLKLFALRQFGRCDGGDFLRHLIQHMLKRQRRPVLQIEIDRLVGIARAQLLLQMQHDRCFADAPLPIQHDGVGFGMPQDAQRVAQNVGASDEFLRPMHGVSGGVGI